MNRPAGESVLALATILVVVSALNPLAINILVPAMPSMRRALGTDIATVQLTLSAYLYATAVAQILLGPLSDRFGRRPVLLVGLLVFVAASLVCAFAPNIAVLVVARIVQGFGGCAGIVLGRAIIRDRFERDRAASMIGYVTMGFAVAPMVAPLIGGVMDDSLGWRSISLFLAAVGVFTFAAAYFAMPETRRPRAPDDAGVPLGRSILALAALPGFWAYALSCAMATSVFFCFLGGTPYVASELLGLSGTEFGIYFICVSVGYIIGNFVTARFSRRYGLFWLMLAGALLTLTAVAAMAAAFAAGWHHPLALFAPMYLVGFANGLTVANALAGAVSVRPDLAGAASGFAGSLQVGIGATATVIVGALLDHTHSVYAMAVAMAVLALVGLAAVLWTKFADV